MSDAATYDDLPDGVVIAGPDGRVVHVNRAAARLLGIEPFEAEGHDFRDVLPLVDLSGRDWWECTDPYGGLRSRTGQPERLLEIASGPKYGEQLLITARYIRDVGVGKVIRLVVSLRGSAARERAERERADLVSTVAHEIRSPLTTVKGFTATLLRKWDLLSDEQRRLMLTAVNSDADRVTRLLSDLLDVSRIEAGRLELRRSLVDLPAVVRSVIEGHVTIGLDPDKFEVKLLGELPELWWDADKIVQIARNLIDNAVRHGAGTVSINMATDTSRDDGDLVVLTVADEGPGIPANLRHRVFSRFWRGGHSAGTGLGLYIVKGLVEAHSGVVSVDEAPSGGALFTVALPPGSPPYDI